MRWFKDGTEIKASKKCVIKSEGASRTLTVNAAESTDSALYTCQTKDDKQEFRVQVKGEQCPGHSPAQQLHFCHGGVEVESKLFWKLFQPQDLLHFLWMPHHGPAKFSSFQKTCEKLVESFPKYFQKLSKNLLKF